MKLWTSKLKKTFSSKKHWTKRPLLSSNSKKPQTIRIISWIIWKKKMMKSKRKISDIKKKRTLLFNWRNNLLKVWKPRSNRLKNWKLNWPNLRKQEKRWRNSWVRRAIACKYSRRRLMTRLASSIVSKSKRRNRISLSRKWWLTSIPLLWIRCRPLMSKNRRFSSSKARLINCLRITYWSK